MSKATGNTKAVGGRNAPLNPPETLATSVFPSFDFQQRTRLVFGLNSVERAGELARGLGAQVVLVVTDPGIVTAGHAHRVEHVLQSCGLGVVVFDQVRENPTTRDVEKCLQVAQSAGVDTIIGLGGSTWRLSRSTSRRIERSVPGASSRWSGTIAVLPASFRTFMWLPRWLTKRQPSFSTARMTSRYFTDPSLALIPH